MTTPTLPASPRSERPPYAVAGIAALAVFALYAVTLAPSIGFWDASEYIAAAHILGIPHPPGNPLFVVLGKVWLLLLEPSGLSVAVRMNLFAAAAGAAAAGFFFLIAHHVLRRVVAEAWMARAGAGVATLLGATAYTVWNQSTVNEKVYTVSVLVIAAVSWLLIRWLDERDYDGSERLLLLAIYLMVLGSTNHLMSVLPLPAVGLIVLLVGLRVLLRAGFWLRLIPLVLVGLSFNFFLPIRAAQGPVINEGEPVCDNWLEAASAIVQNGRGGCPALAASLSRQQYAKPPVTERMAPFADQLENWFQYFDWQWARGVDPSPQPSRARLPFTLLFLGLGFIGLVVVARADPRVGIYLGTLLVLLTVGLVGYLNFKLGYSLSPEVGIAGLHEVRERDYFFVAGFMLWGVMAGIGLAGVWNEIGSRLRSTRGHLLALPILALAVLPLVLNARWASRAGDYAAADWAYDLLMSVEPYAVLFTNGDNDTFPLWYMQEVEGVRRDVTVVVGQYLNTTWYPRQLQRLTSVGLQRPYDPTGAVADLPVGPVPTSPIIDLAPDLMDGVTGGILPEDLTVSFPNLAVSYPSGISLGRSERLALTMIHDSMDERPVYFASIAGMMNQLGLTPWAVRHGLVAKLDLRSLEGEQPADYIQGAEDLGGEWFHYDRTVALYDDVYRFRGLRDREVWQDGATLNIPWHYYALALQLADIGLVRGMDPSRVTDLQRDAARFLVTAQGGSLGTRGPLVGG